MGKGVGRECNPGRMTRRVVGTDGELATVPSSGLFHSVDFPTERPLVTLYLKVQVFTQNKRSVNKNDTGTILHPVDHRRSNGWTTPYTGEGVGEGCPLLAGHHIWEPLVGNVAVLI